jgi:hypothetical protein
MIRLSCDRPNWQGARLIRAKGQPALGGGWRRCGRGERAGVLSSDVLAEFELRNQDERLHQAADTDAEYEHEEAADDQARLSTSGLRTSSTRESTLAPMCKPLAGRMILP